MQIFHLASHSCGRRSRRKRRGRWWYCHQLKRVVSQEKRVINLHLAKVQWNDGRLRLVLGDATVLWTEKLTICTLIVACSTVRSKWRIPKYSML